MADQPRNRVTLTHFKVTAEFDAGASPGDRAVGFLMLCEAQQVNPPGPLLRIGMIMLVGRFKGRPSNVRPCEVLNLKMTPEGEISFALGKIAQLWAFTGSMASDQTIVGRHSYKQPGKPQEIGGPWRAERIPASPLGNTPPRLPV